MKIKQIVAVIDQWSLKPGKLHQRLTSAIEEAIRLGNLPPGTRVPAERALAKELAVSRTTVLTAYNNLRESGWLESRSGSGTWIARRTAAAARASTQEALLAQNPLMNLLRLRDSGAIDFAITATEPLPDLPRSLFRLPEDLEMALLAERNYMPQGLPILCDAIARHYSQMGVPTKPEQILVTSGAQQAISLTASLFVQRGDWAATENPTYFGALEALRFVGARITPLPVGPKHCTADSLRKKLTTHSLRLIYTAPSNQNPTGVSMPEHTRREFARLVTEYSVPLIEDETMAEITYGGKRALPIAAYAPDGPIITIGSLSKLFLPGVRVGWIRGPIAIISRLTKLRATADLGSPLLTQAIGWQLLSYLPQAVEMRNAELTAKRKVLARLLAEMLPEWQFDATRGGPSLWVHAPGVDTRVLSQVALRYQLALAPGPLFSVDDTFSDYLRIPFLDDPKVMKLGLERLVAAWMEVRKVTTVPCRACAMV